MQQKLQIPLWLPVAALALVLLAVGWLREREKPAPLAPPARAEKAHDTEPTRASPAPMRPASAAEPAARVQPATAKPAQASASSAPVVLVHGRIHDATGHVPDSASLSWTDAAGKAASVNQSEGTYITGGLAPGRWTARIQGDGIAPLQETLELAAEPALVEHDFVVELRRMVPVALRTPDGEELLSALRDRQLHFGVPMRISLIATHEPTLGPFKPSSLSHLPGNGCGEYKGRDSGAGSVPEGCCGFFEFKRPAPLWIHVVLGHAIAQSTRIDEIPERLELVVDPARIEALCGELSLRPVDPATGAALTDTFAMLSTRQSGMPVQRDGERLVARSLAPGAYRLDLSATGHCLVQREFVLGGGQKLDLGDVALPATRPLQLHVSDAAGAPLEIQFSIYPLVAGDPRATLGLFQGSFAYQSKADGVADLSGVAPGTWVLITGVQPKERTSYSEPALAARPFLLDTTQAGLTESKIVLEPTAELVLVPASAAAAGLSCWIDTPEGLPARSRRLYNAEPVHLRFAPGAYTLTVEDEDGVELLRRSITLGATPAEVQLPR